MAATMTKVAKAPKAVKVRELTVGEMTFSFGGVLSRHRVAKSGTNHTSYLKGSSLREFLKQAPKNSSVFTYKSFQYNEEFGSGDFYLVKDFGVECGAIQEVSGGYQLVDREGLKNAWNEGVKGLMFLD